MKRFAGDSLFSLFTSFYNENWLKLVSFIVLNQRVIFTGVNCCQTLFQSVILGGGRGGVLPYISPGMCRPIGSGFRAILV